MSVGQALNPQATPWLVNAATSSRHDVLGAHVSANTKFGRFVYWPSVLEGGGLQTTINCS